MSIQLQFKNL